VPIVRAYNSANISINDSTLTALTFDSERYDTDTMHSTVTGTGKLTATTAGTYHIIGQVRFATSAVGVRQISIRLNGTTTLAFKGMSAASASVHGDIVETDYQFNATDYVELIVYQTSGGALNVDVAANYSPEFMMHYVSK
jgi:hypothetical protein